MGVACRLRCCGEHRRCEGKAGRLFSALRLLLARRAIVASPCRVGWSSDISGRVESCFRLDRIFTPKFNLVAALRVVVADAIKNLHRRIAWRSSCGAEARATPTGLPARPDTHTTMANQMDTIV